jgi:hypothetical protein
MPAYSERVSSHRSFIYNVIEYVYSEYPVIVNGFCCTDPFTITRMKCIGKKDTMKQIIVGLSFHYDWKNKIFNEN